VPELRQHERLLVISAQVDVDLDEARVAARDALEAHVRRLSIHQVRGGARGTRRRMLVDEEGWLETYRSLRRRLARIERSIFAARGLEYPEPFGATVKPTRPGTDRPSPWANRLSASVL
jgi:hypothetical protein